MLTLLWKEELMSHNHGPLCRRPLPQNQHGDLSILIPATCNRKKIERKGLIKRGINHLELLIILIVLHFTWLLPLPHQVIIIIHNIY